MSIFVLEAASRTLVAVAGTVPGYVPPLEVDSSSSESLGPLGTIQNVSLALSKLACIQVDL